MNAHPRNDWSPDDEEAILETIDKWVEAEVRPIARKYDQADEYPHDLVEQMRDLGLFGAMISPEFGGLGLPASTYAKIVQKVSAVWMVPSGVFNSHLIMAAAIERNGTEEQKAEWLPKMASGRMRGGIALTEPGAGTDLQAITTRADLDGDSYVLNGAKTWITNSLHGDCLMVLAKTDVTTKPPHKGMSAFLCKKGEGYDVVKKLSKLGYRAIDTCELILDDKRVSSSALLGGEGRPRAAAGARRLGAWPDQCRGEGCRHRRRCSFDGDPLCPGAHDVRQADSRAPSDPAQDRRDGIEGGSGEAVGRGCGQAL